MARLLTGAVLAVTLAGGALAAAGPAQADTGCVVHGTSPVFQAPSTSSPHVGPLFVDSGCGSPFFVTGSAYELCGGGTLYLHITNPRGYVPDACVDWSW